MSDTTKQCLRAARERLDDLELTFDSIGTQDRWDILMGTLESILKVLEIMNEPKEDGIGIGKIMEENQTAEDNKGVRG